MNKFAKLNSKKLKQKNNLQLFSLTFFLIVFTVICSISILSVSDAFEKLADNSSINQVTPLDCESNDENKTVDEDSFEKQSVEDEVEQYICDFTVMNILYNTESKNQINSSLLLMNVSHDIQIPPPKYS